MTLIASARLQVALYDYLSSALDVPLFDAVPLGEMPMTFVIIGEETVTERSDCSTRAAYHDIVLKVVSYQPGFSEAQIVAGKIEEELARASLSLPLAHMVGFWFLSAKSTRNSRDNSRRIDLRYRCLISQLC